MYQIPDAPWITGAERYGTAYTAAWRYGGSVEDYDRPGTWTGEDDDPYREFFDDDYEDDEIELDL